MKTSHELKKFVDEHELYVPENYNKSSEEKFDFAVSLLRAEEEVSFVLVCNTATIKKDKKTVACYTGSGIISGGVLLMFTNKRLIITNYSVPKRTQQYHAFPIYKSNGEQNWDIVEVKGTMLQIAKIIVKFDDGVEFQLSVQTKKCKHVIDELSKYLNFLE